MITKEEAKQVLEEFEEYLFKSDGFDTWWMSSAIKTFIELSDYADRPLYAVPVEKIPNDLSPEDVEKLLEDWQRDGKMEIYRMPKNQCKCNYIAGADPVTKSVTK